MKQTTRRRRVTIRKDRRGEGSQKAELVKTLCVIIGKSSKIKFYLRNILKCKFYLHIIKIDEPPPQMICPGVPRAGAEPRLRAGESLYSFFLNVNRTANDAPLPASKERFSIANRTVKNIEDDS